MSEIQVDAISERTSAAGVTVDGMLIKDGQVGGVGLSSGSVSALRVREAVLTPTYGATIDVDASQGSFVKIVATDTNAFTINAPSNLSAGQHIVYDIVNSSGGALGTITWAATFLLAGAFTSPADTKRRTIEFYYDGTNLVEVTRASADI